MIHIKPFSEAYQAAVIALIVPIQSEEFGIAITAAQQPDLSDIAQFYQNGNGNFWLALDDEELVGTIALRDIGAQQVALRKMFVSASHRGGEKGVAKHLLDCAVAACRQNSVKQIFLGTTAQFVGAQRFYEKNGFGEIAKQDLPKRFPVMAVDTKFYCLNLLP